MAIPKSRSKDPAEITVNADLCNGIKAEKGFLLFFGYPVLRFEKGIRRTFAAG